ncbi:hypothetical protein L484_019946 [Morus notabilis]|uniref:Uncharacterized protein n=1 Tax=Morus notabilis TaxID=981085 RepID=W9QX04_9ROSA|nr:hypothetical protein L484_019946 [Morus notabilis]
MGIFSSLCACLESLRPCRTADQAAAAGDADEILEAFDLFFDLHSLQIATNFFSELNKLGHGGFGPVYKDGEKLGIPPWWCDPLLITSQGEIGVTSSDESEIGGPTPSFVVSFDEESLSGKQLSLLNLTRAAGSRFPSSPY